MEDEAPGVPEWVVTYGDMMSLLLTFFIMLVSLSDIEAEDQYRAVMQALQSYLGYTQAPVGPPGKSFPLNSLVARMDMLGAFRKDVKKEKRGIGGVKVQAPKGTELRVFRGREGTAIVMEGQLAFPPGKVEITPEVKEIALSIAVELAGKPNKIEVRGHTSTDPLPPDCPFTKSQLSYERARGIWELLKSHGIKQDRLRISAAADTEPIDDVGDDETSHPDRVTIFVLDTYVGEFVGTADAVD